MKLGGNSNGRVAASKGVPFSKNPVLAVRLPVWRSRVVLFLLFFAFAGLGARALWLQGVSTQFLQKQGKARYERTLELPGGGIERRAILEEPCTGSTSARLAFARRAVPAVLRFRRPGRARAVAAGRVDAVFAKAGQWVVW